MKPQDINKVIKRKIESLDDTLPQNVSWKVEKSWEQIQEKLAPTPRRRIIPLVYLSGVAACIVLVLISKWILNQPESTQQVSQKLVQLDSIEKKKLVEQEVQVDKKQKKLRPEYELQDENYEPNQLSTSSESMQNLVPVVEITPDKDSVIIQPQKDIPRVADVLIPTPDSVIAIAEVKTPQTPKKQINQNVVLTVAPSAKVWQRKKRKSSKKTKYNAPKKLRLKFKLEANSRQYALNK